MRDKRINWNIMAILAPVLVAIIGWGYSIENRLAAISSSTDVVNRVQILEELVTPLVVEHRVAEKLKELGIDVHGRYGSVDPPVFDHIGDALLPSPHKPPNPPNPPNPPKPPKPPEEPKLLPPQPSIEDIREEAKDWANSQIRQEAL